MPSNFTTASLLQYQGKVEQETLSPERNAMASTAIEPPTAAPNGNHKPLSKPTSAESQAPLPPPKHIPTLTAVMPEPPKCYKDVLAYEDKWIGWDGPVWCKRYGRFENVDDAAKDDGFDSSGQVHHQGTTFRLPSRFFSHNQPQSSLPCN